MWGSQSELARPLLALVSVNVRPSKVAVNGIQPATHDRSTMKTGADGDRWKLGLWTFAGVGLSSDRYGCITGLVDGDDQRSLGRESYGEKEREKLFAFYRERQPWRWPSGVQYLRQWINIELARHRRRRNSHLHSLYCKIIWHMY